MLIQKRNGQVVEFNLAKIRAAIEKAFQSCSKSVDDNIAKYVYDELKYRSDYAIPVEEIQNIVERQLMQGCHFEVAKAFILH